MTESQNLPANIHPSYLSISSLRSDALSFHSAQPSPDLERPQTTPQQASNKKLEAITMSRTDSGYDDGLPASRRSNSTTSSRPRRENHNHTSSSSSSRPVIHRATRSTPSAYRVGTARPSLQSRYTTSSSPPRPYTFFQFPSLADPEPPAPPRAPTPTVHYWTSEETRRLEYAAIDNASRGVRGFVTRLLPDCILPNEYRRTRFHNEHEDDDSDAGSVRRYRLSLPAERKTLVPLDISNCGEEKKEERPGLLRRLTGLGSR